MKIINNKLLLAIVFALIASCDPAVDPEQSLDFDLTNFFLKDINPNSSTHDAYISPSDYSDRVQLYYFPFKST